MRQAGEASQDTTFLALPSLRGRASAALQIVWAAALILTLAAMAIGNYRSYVRSSERPFSHIGLGWYEDRGEIRLRDPTSPEAAAAGIRRGDVIVAVDGKRVGSSLEWAPDLDDRLKGAEGSRVELATRGADGRVRTHRLTRTRHNLDAAFAGSGLTSEAYRWMTVVANGLPDIFILVAAILLFRGRRDEPVGMLLSLSLLLVIATGGGAWSFWQSAALSQVRDILSAAAALGLVAALLAFPDGRIERRWGGAVLAAAMSWSLVSLALTPAELDTIVWMALMLMSVGLMARRYRRLPAGRERQQIRWAMLGFSWGVILLALSAIVGWVERSFLDVRTAVDVWAAVAAQILGALGIICFAAGLLVSLLRYRLYDVDTVISRSAVYGLMTVAFVAVFAGTQEIIETLSAMFLASNSAPLSGGIAAAIGAAVIVPLHGRMNDWAERRFQKALIHLRRDLPESIEDLRDAAEIGEIAAEVLGRVAAGVHASHGALIVGNSVEQLFRIDGEVVEEWLGRAVLDSAVASLDCDRADTCFPMRVPLRTYPAADRELHGWLLLGPRPDGSFYGADEREALGELAAPIARAIRVVELRNEREAKLACYVDDRLASLERRLADISSEQSR